MLWQTQTASDKDADHHLHDALDPADYADKTSYCDAVHRRHLEWQRHYLDGEPLR
jgi:hypothetical protein